MSAFYELRRYQLQPGRRAEWVEYMETVIIPYQISRGMVVTASFVDEEHPDIYFWMRRFESEEQREALYAATYEHPTWQGEIGPKARAMMVEGANVITRLSPTPRSPVR